MEMACLQPGDLVCDLGCGDGRILVAAARHEGVGGLGIEIDERLIATADERVQEAGLADAVEFRCGDFFKVDFSSATVVTMFLINELNKRLAPHLNRLPKGARILSVAFPIPAFEPVEIRKIHTEAETQPVPIFKYVTPLV